MNQTMLQSIINLTEQGNIESLEHNLPSSIAALMPVNSVSIYKPIPDNDYSRVEEILKFLVQDTTPSYLWSAESAVLNTEEALKTCFRSSSVQERQKNNGHNEIYYPIEINGSTVAAVRVESKVLDQNQRLMLDSITNIYKNYLTILKEGERDNLTSLLNKRGFKSRFDKLITLQKFHQRALWEEYEEPEKRQIDNTNQVHLAIINLDSFQEVNNQIGYAQGDQILIELSSLMQQSFRNSDHIFRFNSDIFAVLLEPSSRKDALQTLQRFQKDVREHLFTHSEKLSVSIGFTAINDKKDAISACQDADNALNQAKMNKRKNNIQYFDESLVLTHPIH